MKRCLLLSWLLIATISLSAQTVKDFAVQVSASVQNNPPKIIFGFPLDANAVSYNVYRKSVSASSWGTKVTSLAATATSYEDTDVQLGDNYEYRFEKIMGGSNVGYGYIYAGINAPAIEHHGRMVVVVDSTFISSLAVEILQLRNDLIGDGWSVSIIYAGRNDKPEDVKAGIKDIYNTFTDTKAVLLLGHVPVPYSGNFGQGAINVPPDGHTPDHNGAWPADVYYGELTDLFEDVSVDNTSGINREANKNIPGDGKFDNTVLGSEVELAVGRIDLYDMPMFGVSEEDLLRAYLTKAHNWKHNISAAVEKAIIDDNFGLLGTEKPGVLAWRTFAAMVGAANINVTDYFTALRQEDYLIAYGSGAGSYKSANGIGRTDSFAVATNNAAVFNILFGSYFGDWDNTDNFLRAPLAAKRGLVSCWGGRPQWYLQHMGLGETIGYTNRLTNNNRTGLYHQGFFATGIHVALMGDPSLRMHRLSPVSNVSAQNLDNNSKVKLTWTASPDPDVIGYYIYRAGDYWKDFIRHHDYMITTTEWTDSLPRNGNSIYHVRAVKLQESASGTYYNMSQGVFVEVTGITGGVSVGKVEFANSIKVYPNPAKNSITVSWATENNPKLNLTITDVTGKVMYKGNVANNSRFDISHYSAGIYYVTVSNDTYSAVKKLVVY